MNNCRSPSTAAQSACSGRTVLLSVFVTHDTRYAAIGRWPALLQIAMQKSCARFERLGSIVGVASGIGVQALVGRAQAFIKLDLAIAVEALVVPLNVE